MIYYALLGALALQRLNEVKFGSANLERMKPKLVSRMDLREKNQMLVLHGSWFSSCAAEHALNGALVAIPWFLAGVILLCLCQLIRHLSMNALGDSWTHLPVAYHGQKIVSTGIYRYLRHPNYLAVAVEIAVVPLLAQAYVTASLFTVLNGLFLYRRIQLEETQLKKASKI